MDFTNKTVLVTGGAMGIGAATVRRLAAEGARVILADVNDSAAEKVVRDVSRDVARSGGQVEFQRVDVADPESITAMAQAVLGKTESLHGLVNNAGIGGIGKFLLELSIEEWNEMLRVDLTSAFLFCKAVLPSMISQGRGRIVNIASITAMMGVAGSTYYAAAKAGVIGFSKSLAREVADKRINVNVVAPGLIDTDMARKRGIDHQRHFVAWPRIGEPADIAGVVAFLLSDQAEFITGQVISPNGGAYM